VQTATAYLDTLNPEQRRAVEHGAADGLAAPPSPGELSKTAEAWRPFRTWAGVLIRVAGDRDGIAWEPQTGGGR